MEESDIYQLQHRELRRALKQADSALFEASMRFLEDDPKTFGSGYVKEMIWKYIKRYPLTSAHIERLQQVGLNYLNRPMSREFKFMCQTLAQIATIEFWKQVNEMLNADNPRVQINAYCLHAYSEGVDAGERKRLELDKIKHAMRTLWRADK